MTFPRRPTSMNDNGRMIKASKWGERALTNEPVYQGEPIFAVAAVDELTCAEAIEKIKIDMEPLPFVDRSAGQPAAGRPESARGRKRVGAARAAPNPAAPQLTEVKWTDADFADYDKGNLPMGHAPDDMDVSAMSMPASRMPR